MENKFLGKVATLTELQSLNKGGKCVDVLQFLSVRVCVVMVNKPTAAAFNRTARSFPAAAECWLRRRSSAVLFLLVFFLPDAK